MSEATPDASSSAPGARQLAGGGVTLQLDGCPLRMESRRPAPPPPAELRALDARDHRVLQPPGMVEEAHAHVGSAGGDLLPSRLQPHRGVQAGLGLVVAGPVAGQLADDRREVRLRDLSEDGVHGRRVVDRVLDGGRPRLPARAQDAPRGLTRHVGHEAAAPAVALVDRGGDVAEQALPGGGQRPVAFSLQHHREPVAGDGTQVLAHRLQLGRAHRDPHRGVARLLARIDREADEQQERDDRRGTTLAASARHEVPFRAAEAFKYRDGRAGLSKPRRAFLGL